MEHQEAAEELASKTTLAPADARLVLSRTDTGRATVIHTETWVNLPGNEPWDKWHLKRVVTIQNRGYYGLDGGCVYDITVVDRIEPP